jgi:amylosucrase
MQVSEQWLDEQAALSLARLLPRLEPLLTSAVDDASFKSRLRSHFPDFFRAFYSLYNGQYDFFYHLEQTLLAVTQMYVQRPEELKRLDEQRERDPRWFTSHTMMGAVAYVDRFAGTLQGIRERIPYFQELGLTYLHLMPLFRCPEEHNDGGYAVSSFREVNPKLGTMAELAQLTREFRDAGISLVLDFVFNHTADEHEWARRALAGDREYQAFYLMFDDRMLPDQYEPNLREIFPEYAPGSFTYRPDVKKWVWTTFYPFQWDLNYANPAVFRAMLCEILFLANQGVEVLRLDAVPFVWKQMGTPCENLPQVHDILRGFNALVRVAAPALLFKSEAIVHPRDVRSYVGADKCQLSYNPILMVSIWEALATRDVTFFRHTLDRQFPLSPDCAWINYVRSHDDIGWGFADEDAAEVGINGFDHRYFLNQFYTGRFLGSFAQGLPFNFNPKTQDMRISGTTASLAGLEKGLELGDPQYVETAIRRLTMMQSIALSAGGIPLIYLGDEVGTTNDYGYRDDPTTAGDNRWVHRPKADPEHYARRADPTTPEGRLFAAICSLIRVRKATPELADARTRFVDTRNRHVLGFTRHNRVLVLANFSEFPQTVDIDVVRRELGTLGDVIDLVTGAVLSAGGNIALDQYGFVWLKARPVPSKTAQVVDARMQPTQVD